MLVTHTHSPLGHVAQVLFSEKDIDDFRKCGALKNTGLPKNHWVQLTFSQAGTLLNAYPTGVNRIGLAFLERLARKQIKKDN